MERFCSLFLIISFLSILDLFRNKSYQLVLFIMLFAFVLIVGFRGTLGLDTWTYIYSWKNTPPFLYLDLSKVYLLAYSEPGFLFLSSLIKSVYNNIDFYFCIISGLTAFFLYKSICRYSYVYPLIAFVYYCARFMLFRDINQIRAAFAIAIVIFSIQYIGHNWKKYCLLIFLATSMHYSAMIAFPCYFILRLRLSKIRIIQILVCTLVIAALSSALIREYTQHLFSFYGMKESYTMDNSSYSQGYGLLNPVIYYQILVLLVYTFLEDKLRGYDLYILFRNLYLFSTCILILFSNFLVLAGRLSTIYATLEMFLFPQIFYGLTSNLRPKNLGWFALMGLCCLLFYLNYNKLLNV